MKTPKQNKKSGAIIVVVMVILVTFTLFVSALLQLSGFNAQETERQIRESQAFWIAEEGVQQALLKLSTEGVGSISPPEPELAFDAIAGRSATYEVQDNGTHFTSIGRLTIGAVTITNRIRFETNPVWGGYSNAVSGLNESDEHWVLPLGGSGTPIRGGNWNDNGGIPGPGDTEVGGPREIWGNVYAGGEEGDIYMSGDGRIRAAPDYKGNPSQFVGDASAGRTITTVDNATISGDRNENAAVLEGPDLIGMDYPNTASHNLTKIFDAEGVTFGRLSVTNPLYNLVRRSGDDYYFEPTGGSSRETLDLGDGRVYYADGDIWFNKSGPLQFDIDGTATIVASGDFHIGDGLRYIDPDPGGDLLALVALGKYNEITDELESGGDIYFGDAQFGTVYEMDAFMFAAHDFYYSVNASDGSPGEPDTGFKIFGNFVALNQLHIDLDWYNLFETDDRDRITTDEARPTVFNVADNRWEDALTGTPLTEAQINGDSYRYKNRRGRWRTKTYPGMRQYQMIVKYDERIYDPETQLFGLPQGDGSGGAGGELTKWQHADADDS